ncbi:MAG: sigma-70 family RNA polymerase sigma factor [Acidobacteria bacterium]|nr:sigma-70 family RNA polymerase sigma factor [Acidobacteriota bacterium]
MSGDVTRLLQQWGDGDSDAFETLIPLVYDELRKLAAAHLRNERGGHTLQPTGLVHEAYMRLTDRPTGNWKGRAQFYAVASQVIRRVLVDHARGRLRQKRGGGTRHLVLIDAGVDWPIERSIQIDRLEDALDALAVLDATQARIVELRFFTGLTIDEAADVLDLSPATVKRSWSSARAWLLRELGGPSPAPARRATG